MRIRNSEMLNTIVRFGISCLFINICFSPAVLCSTLPAVRISVLIPESTETAERFAAELETAMADGVSFSDRGLARTVLLASDLENPFNMTLTEARNIGTGIGCSYFILLKGDTFRRTSLSRSKYFESYTAVFFVDARSGELIDWHLASFDEDSPEASLKALLGSAAVTAERFKKLMAEPRGHSVPLEPASLPDMNDSNARFPMPFKRMRPGYTPIARRYDIEATVDVVAEIDKNGAVSGTRIVRWAGFGLDQSVIETVKNMTWRPADIGNEKFTMQILLRYNFRDIKDSKDQDPKFR